MPDEEWLYARVHQLDHADGDALLMTFASRWVAAARDAGAGGWFFIRYVDMGGPHLRVRFHGAPDVLDECHTVGKRLWAFDTSHGPGAAAPPERLHPEAATGLPDRGQRRLSFGLYGREHHYYGTTAAVRVAESMFQRSSEWALDTVARTGSDRRHRARLAIEMMRGCVSTLGPDQSVGFWSAHWRYWTAALRDPGRLRQAEDHAAHWQRLLTCVPADVPYEHDQVAAARDTGRALADGVREALAVDPTASAARLLLMHIHMTFNRLGFLPLEEALIGRVAAVAPLTACP